MRRTYKAILATIIITSILFITGFFQLEFGRCMNAQGDGKVYNGEPFYNYISYRDIANENDIVMTFSINNFYGECAWRADFVVLKNI